MDRPGGHVTPPPPSANSTAGKVCCNGRCSRNLTDVGSWYNLSCGCCICLVCFGDLHARKNLVLPRCPKCNNNVCSHRAIFSESMGRSSVRKSRDIGSLDDEKKSIHYLAIDPEDAGLKSVEEYFAGPECDQGKRALLSVISKSKKGDCLTGFSIDIDFRAADVGCLANEQKDKFRKLGGFLKSVLLKDDAEGKDPARYQEFDSKDDLQKFAEGDNSALYHFNLGLLVGLKDHPSLGDRSDLTAKIAEGRALIFAKDKSKEAERKKMAEEAFDKHNAVPKMDMERVKREVDLEFFSGTTESISTNNANITTIDCSMIIAGETGDINMETPQQEQLSQESSQGYQQMVISSTSTKGFSPINR